VTKKFQSLEVVRRHFSNRWKKWAAGSVCLGLAGMGVLALAVRWVPFDAAALQSYPASLMLTDRQGQPLRVWLGPRDLDCRPLYEPQRGDWIAQAIVAAEDQRFWRHHGVDPAALLRALKQNVTSLRTVSGASTLSTQVIRLVEPRRRNLWTKCAEAFRALQLERRCDKAVILGQYLNRAPFGANIVGIEAAARRYFGKGAADLSLAEASLLAGLPQSPSRLRPDRHPARAKKRQQYVLDRMLACGFITSNEFAEASAQPVAVRTAPYPFRAPHFTAWVDQRLCSSRSVSGTDATHGSAATTLRTTLDAGLQRVAEESLRRHASVLAGQGIRGGAVVILDVKNSAVRALVGSPDYRDRRSGQVNGALAERSAGSTLKPFAFARALDRGQLTPQSVLADVPALFRDYEPENFDSGFRGLVSARDALVLSLNLPALEVEQRIGQPVFYDTLRALGFDTLRRPAAHYGLGLVLGNGEVRLVDLVNAYACLARGGVMQPPRVLENEALPAGRTLFSPEACWLVTDMMSGEERAMDTTGHAADVRLPPLAWKTGTSAGFRDAWTIAYNPDYVIGVWVGNPDGAGVDRLVGRKVATPIVWEIFRRLYPDNDGPWFARPEGVVIREVCAVSGGAPGSHCPHRVEDFGIEGVTRQELCTVHRADGQEHWPVEIATFLQQQQAPPAQRPVRPEPLRIVSPARGSTFRLLESMASGEQRLSLEAASGVGGEPLHWFVNDQYLGASRPGLPAFWSLQRGTHQIVCSDARGGSDRVQIAVE
jgi:penicillin-binding protein 1C